MPDISMLENGNGLRIYPPPSIHQMQDCQATMKLLFDLAILEQ